jgi:hypothetical protein
MEITLNVGLAVAPIRAYIRGTLSLGFQNLFHFKAYH